METTNEALEKLATNEAALPAERIDALLELSQRIRQNEVLKALGLDEQAKQMAIAAFDNDRWALALRSLSDDYMLIGDNTQALQNLQECLVLVEPMGDNDKLASIYLNIGAIHNRMANEEKAGLFYQKALHCFQQEQNELGVAKCMANIGLLLMEEGKFQEAEDYFHRSIAISQKLGARIGEAINSSNLGNLYSKTGKSEESRAMYQQALDIYTEIGHKSGIAATLVNLGNTSALLGNFEKALDQLHRALELNQNLGTRYYEVATHKNLFEVYERLERWPEAFAHLKKYHQLKEEVLSNEAKQKAAEIEMQGQVVIKEREYEIEKLRNVELKKAYEELQTAQDALLEKERLAIHGSLASEIAHEVQNPLQFVTNFAPLNVELLEELQEALAANDTAEIAMIMDDLARNCRSIEEHGKRVASIIMQLQLKR